MAQTLSDKKERRIEFAPQEALKFVLPGIEDVFLTFVLGHPEAWVSDMSTLHFMLDDRDPSFAERPGSKPGYFVFRRPDAEDFEYEEVEEKGFDHKAQIIRRAKLCFGVDIDPVFGETFPKIFHYISKNLTDKKKEELAPGGKLLRRLEFFLNHPLRHVSTYYWNSPSYCFIVEELYGGGCTIYAREQLETPVDDDAYYPAGKKGDKFLVADDLWFPPARTREELRKTWIPNVRTWLNKWLKERSCLPLKNLRYEED